MDVYTDPKLFGEFTCCVQGFIRNGESCVDADHCGCSGEERTTVFFQTESGPFGHGGGGGNSIEECSIVLPAIGDAIGNIHSDPNFFACLSNDVQ